ncbi:hypothetical protein [Pandoraea aquatica]|uniref:hypothetical protein n=1 Tax=Pandoraea aquatica TaxID=2508290 RepID=UPI0015818414|nr:hypothetical protein [Pandoraea aquatica]
MQWKAHLNNKLLIQIVLPLFLQIGIRLLDKCVQSFKPLLFDALIERDCRQCRRRQAHRYHSGSYSQANSCLTQRIRLRTIPSHSTTPIQFASNDEFPHHASDSGFSAAIVPANSGVE